MVPQVGNYPVPFLYLKTHKHLCETEHLKALSRKSYRPCSENKGVNPHMTAREYLTQLNMEEKGWAQKARKTWQIQVSSVAKSKVTI